MNFAIHRDPEVLESTAFVEIGPGRYSDNHWQQGFLFVHEDAFTFAEGILRKHHAEFDHFAMNDIPRSHGLQIVANWQTAARRIQEDRGEQAIDSLVLGDRLKSHLAADFLQHRAEISKMLTDLASYVGAYYEAEEWVCVLGV